MVVTVPGDSGILVRSIAAVELVQDNSAHATTLPHSMEAMTALYWESVLNKNRATLIASLVKQN